MGGTRRGPHGSGQCGRLLPAAAQIGSPVQEASDSVSKAAPSQVACGFRLPFIISQCKWLAEEAHRTIQKRQLFPRSCSQPSCLRQSECTASEAKPEPAECMRALGRQSLQPEQSGLRCGHAVSQLSPTRLPDPSQSFGFSKDRRPG